ncbi:MAG: twin-arginine translocase TatA/TatE family subunit [Candidatus Aureabacteria bacterium]|nr:twin-arginine translocase TatA/TatE family subunit [Candidatus Auribacterota bacterium]
MFHFGAGELVLIFLIVLLLFGAKRLPEIARSLGKAIREFKKAGKDIQDDSDGKENKDSQDKTP